MSRYWELLKEMDRLMLAAFHQSAQYGEDLFHAQPEPGKWSLQQVLHHIWFTADGCLKVIRKKAGKPATLQDATWVSAFRYFLLKMMLYLPFKYKAPQPVSNVPNDISFDVLKSNWDQTVAGFSELLENFQGDMDNKLVFQHPIAGWFTLQQTLSFMLDHMEHHQKQLEGLYSWLEQKK